MRFDSERHRREFWTTGVTVVPPGVIPSGLVADWREFALARARLLGRHLDAVADNWTYQQDGERHAYAMVGGRAVRRHLAEMGHWYRALVPLVSVVTFEDVRTSGHEESDVNVLLYDRPGDAIGWHLDTNPVTVLVYLTDNTEGGTECRLLARRPEEATERTRVIRPEAGAVLLMQGRRVWHRGLPLVTERKAVAVWNYYTADDDWRPDGFDDVIYGPAGVASPAGP